MGGDLFIKLLRVTRTDSIRQRNRPVGWGLGIGNLFIYFHCALENGHIALLYPIKSVVTGKTSNVPDSEM